MKTNKDLTVWHRELWSLLGGSLDGRAVWGRVDTCRCMAEPLRCSPETITTLLIGYVVVWLQSHVRLFCSPRDYIVCQAPLSMGFPRQENWSGLPFPSLEDLPHPGIKPEFPALVHGFSTAESPGKPIEAH